MGPVGIVVGDFNADGKADAPALILRMELTAERLGTSPDLPLLTGDK